MGTKYAPVVMLGLVAALVSANAETFYAQLNQSLLPNQTLYMQKSDSKTTDAKYMPCATGCQTDKLQCTESEDGQEGEIYSENWPDKPYEAPFNTYCVKEFPIGYTIEVIIDALNIDASNGDAFLYIRGGNKQHTQEKGPILTWNKDPNKPFKFKIYHSNYLFVQFVQTKRNVNKYLGFKLKYRSTGEITTTEPPATTITPLPTIAPDLPNPNITVYIKGLTPPAFTTLLPNFKNIMSTFTNEFSINKKLEVQECLPTNIVVETVSYCPLTWPDHNICAEVIFSIPLQLKEEKLTTKKTSRILEEAAVNLPDLNYTKFELSKAHLVELWNAYSTHSDIIELGVQPYDSPDDARILTIWVGISLGVICVFLIVLYCIWKANMFTYYSSLNENISPSRQSIESEVNGSRISDTNSAYDPNYTGIDNRTPFDSDSFMLHDPTSELAVPMSTEEFRKETSSPPSYYARTMGAAQTAPNVMEQPGVTKHVLSEDDFSDYERNITYRDTATTPGTPSHGRPILSNTNPMLQYSSVDGVVTKESTS